MNKSFNFFFEIILLGDLFFLKWNGEVGKGDRSRGLGGRKEGKVVVRVYYMREE